MKLTENFDSIREKATAPNPRRFRIPNPSLLGFSFLFLLLPFALQATTYYVATTGNDGNPGTQASPFQHVSKGVAQAVAGDVVVVADGTYDNEGAVEPNNVVNLKNSGTASQPITIMAEHRGAAILDGGLTSTSSCNGAYSYFNLGNAAYIVIQGFQIQHTCDDAIHDNDSAHNIVIRQNEMHHIANIPITDTIGRVATGCPTTAHDIVIDGNTIHNIGRSNTGFTNSLDHGLYVSCSNLTISNNVFYNQVDGWDIQLANGANNVLVVYNTFASHNPGQNGQIMVWNAHSGLTIRDNIFYNPPGEAVTNYTPSVSNCSIDTNLISGTAGVYTASGCSTSGNLMNVDPDFVNAQADDFQLQPNSPAIDKGVVIPSVTIDITGTFRPQGSAPDLGAYESASGSVATVPSSTPAPPVPAATGLAADWGFTEGQGTTVADLSNNQNTGTIVGTPNWVSGTYGTALSLNGVNNYVDVAESASLEQSKELTVSFWILASQTSGDPRIVSKSYSWDVKLNGQSRYPQFSAAGKYAMLQHSLPVGTWQHVVFTFSSGSVKGYVNGVSQPFAQNTFAGNEILPAMPYGLRIGADAEKANLAKGFIRDVRLYDSVLTAAEIQALYSQTNK